MIPLGMRVSTYGTDTLVKENWPALPASFPTLPEGHYVVCGFGEGNTERLFVAESREDMQKLHDAYQNGAGTCINWYTGHNEIGTIARMD